MKQRNKNRSIVEHRSDSGKTSKRYKLFISVMKVLENLLKVGILFEKFFQGLF